LRVRGDDDRKYLATRSNRMKGIGSKRKRRPAETLQGKPISILRKSTRGVKRSSSALPLGLLKVFKKTLRLRNQS
jgi:hypothetical protein